MHIPPNWGTFFALIVSFLVFWFIFSRLFFRPFLNLLSDRERRFKELNDRTEELIKQARAAEEEREARLAEVRKTAIARRETERRKAEAEAAQMMEAAKAEARETLDQVSAKIETELKAAEHELDQMGHSLARDLAERVLGRPLNGGVATTTGKNN
jgi:F-type H+-transporting ATPase subunit b